MSKWYKRADFKRDYEAFLEAGLYISDPAELAGVVFKAFRKFYHDPDERLWKAARMAEATALVSDRWTELELLDSLGANMTLPDRTIIALTELFGVPVDQQNLPAEWRSVEFLIAVQKTRPLAEDSSPVEPGFYRADLNTRQWLATRRGLRTNRSDRSNRGNTRKLQIFQPSAN